MSSVHCPINVMYFSGRTFTVCARHRLILSFFGRSVSHFIASTAIFFWPFAVWKTEQNVFYSFSSLIIQNSVCYHIVWCAFSIVVSICLLFSNSCVCVFYLRRLQAGTAVSGRASYSLFLAYLFNLFGCVLTLARLKSQQFSALAQATSAITTCCALI